MLTTFVIKSDQFVCVQSQHVKIFHLHYNKKRESITAADSLICLTTELILFHLYE